MRTRLKELLARIPDRRPARGSTFLIYHRVGGGSPDERDLPAASFRRQLDLLAEHDVVAVEEALRRVAVGESDPSVVLTFDDGFGDVYDAAWPLLRERRLPFTLYLTTAYVGGEMRWDGSTAKAAGPALTWRQLEEMVASGLCTVGNHTHTHATPERLDVAELDECTSVVQDRLGVTPRHFAYTWGVDVPEMHGELAARFVSAATGTLGRNDLSTDPMSLNRVPVRGSDPLPFFAAKLRGRLVPERSYARVVQAAKAAGVSG